VNRYFQGIWAKKTTVSSNFRVVHQTSEISVFQSTVNYVSRVRCTSLLSFRIKFSMDFVYRKFNNPFLFDSSYSNNRRRDILLDYCESKKLGHFNFYCNFVKCWPILIILSLSEPEIISAVI